MPSYTANSLATSASSLSSDSSAHRLCVKKWSLPGSCSIPLILRMHRSITNRNGFWLSDKTVPPIASLDPDGSCGCHHWQAPDWCSQPPHWPSSWSAGFGLRVSSGEHPTRFDRKGLSRQAFSSMEPKEQRAHKQHLDSRPPPV